MTHPITGDLVMMEPGSIPFFPQRPASGGHFRGQLGLTPQLFSLKYNGWMGLLHLPTKQMWNRHGKKLSIENDFSAAIEQLYGDRYAYDGMPMSDGAKKCEWLVCEALQRRHHLGQGSLFVIDYMPTGKFSDEDWSFAMRQEWLSNWIEIHPPWVKPTPDSTMLISNQSISDESLVEMWNDIPRLNEEWGCEFYEGFVATQASSPYKRQHTANNKCSHIIKYRYDN